jgi:hydrogenase nickel incorporation protein HypA/HybF
MHELSLAGSILALVEEAAVREAFTRVLQLRLEVGRLAAVEVSALRFALESLAPGTVLEGAEVVMDEPPGRAVCPGCGQAVEIVVRGESCPCCGAHGLVPRGGDALRVVDLQVV